MRASCCFPPLFLRPSPRFLIAHPLVYGQFHSETKTWPKKIEPDVWQLWNLNSDFVKNSSVQKFFKYLKKKSRLLCACHLACPWWKSKLLQRARHPGRGDPRTSSDVCSPAKVLWECILSQVGKLSGNKVFPDKINNVSGKSPEVIRAPVPKYSSAGNLLNENKYLKVLVTQQWRWCFLTHDI